jgi:hypothetical protein
MMLMAHRIETYHRIVSASEGRNRIRGLDTKFPNDFNAAVTKRIAN